MKNPLTYVCLTIFLLFSVLCEAQNKKQVQFFYNNLEFYGDSHSSSAGITANVDYKLKLNPQKSNTWISCRGGKGIVYFDLKDNKSESDRRCQIIAYNEELGISDTLTITQKWYGSNNKGGGTKLYSSPQKSTSKKVVSTRCIAITKKGTQCSRNAAPGSSYCWQHKK